MIIQCKLNRGIRIVSIFFILACYYYTIKYSNNNNNVDVTADFVEL